MVTATASALTLTGKSLAFTGQQYLPVVPRQLSLTFRGDASEDASHVVAVSSAPVVTTDDGARGAAPAADAAGLSSACLFVVEWSDRAGSSGSSSINEDQHTTTASRTTRVVVKPPSATSTSSSPHITHFTSLTYGENLSGLCFPIGLSDDTVVLVSRNVDEDGEVTYVQPGAVLRYVGKWTASCVVQRSVHGGRVAAAHYDSDNGGNVVSLIDIANNRLEYAARLTPVSSGLSSFPITQLEHLRSSETGEVVLSDEEGFGVELLALCHTVILHLRCATLPRGSKPVHPSMRYSAGAVGGAVQVLNAWRWSPLDPIDVFTHRGHRLFAGTSDGTIAVWDTNAGALPSSQFQCNVTPSSSSPYAAKRRAAGVNALVVRSDSTLVAGSSNGLVSLWSANGSKDWRSSQAEEYHSIGGGAGVVGEALHPTVGGGSATVEATAPTSLYGYPPISGLASTHKYLVGADESGMLTVWRWLR